MATMGKTQARRVMAALVGAAAAVVFGVGGALAVGTSDDGPAGPSPVESVPPASAGGGEVSGGSDGGSPSGSGGSVGGVSEGGSDGSDSGGNVSGSGGTDGGVSGSSGGPGPSASPSGPPPTGGPGPTPSDPTDPADLAERIDALEKKVDELPTKKELADALRAFADSLEEQG
ncbi:hypothetical protein [Streptomyces californicus]|uniref:hypothetical protein n=1 Tax=Streptomyces californicus TaxID=67351 RepID=UPI001E321BA9|nr:hypothetical protein [Streptomyces californicus]MCC0574112.1 hypothetical protein [Streptomyces californicus]